MEKVDIVVSKLPQNLSEGMSAFRADAFLPLPHGPSSGQQTVLVLRTYYTPIVITLGLLTNLITVTVFRMRKLRPKVISCSHYLIAIALVDMAFLISLLFLWLADRGVAIYEFGIVCHLLTFSSQTSNFLSVWYTVGMAIDAYIWTRMPEAVCLKCQCFRGPPTRIRRNVHSTKTTYRFVYITSVTILAIVVYLNLSLTVGVVDMDQQNLCVPLPVFLHALETLGKLDMCFNFLIPHVIVIWITLSLCHRLFLYERSRNRLVRWNSGKVPMVLSKKDRNGLRATIALCWVFLVLTTPSQALRTYYTAINKDQGGPRYAIHNWEYVLQHIFQLLYYTSFSAKSCVLLCWFRVFRKATKKLVKCLCRFRHWPCAPKPRARRTSALALEAFSFTFQVSSTLVGLKEASLL